MFETTEKSLKRRKIQLDCILCRNCYISYSTKIAMKKCRENWIEKYGVDNPAKAKEVQDKMKATCLEKYGTEYQIASQSTKQKIKSTFNEKYGVNSAAQVKEIRDKQKETCLEKYGTENPFQNKEIYNKARKTMKERYGVEFSAQNKELKNKQEETCLKNHGARYPMCCKDVKHGRCIYNFDNKKFDSSWELFVYAYLKDNKQNFEYHPNVNFIYIVNGVKHRYFPDFKIDNIYYEVKGNQFLKDGKLWDPYSKKFQNEKWNCMIKNNVKLLIKDDILEYRDHFLKNYGKASLYRSEEGK